ncbi:hypothetical protein DYB32_001923 [Aphanomyces invadans]|uniref:Uncharacterized protein n=1 Tax=Aphanomyces invadans TaxID=157072 RepID=A0A3R7D4P3_9STRA|nr:hypothetical protein DYB32_001923 [Aphanomyces invadans]
MNAVLQAMLCLPAFTQVVRTESWVADVVPGTTMKLKQLQLKPEEFELYTQFKAMVKSKAAKKALMHPGALKAELSKRAPIFADKEQQDAHEFFSTFLHELEEDMTRLAMQVLVASEATTAGKQTLLSYFGPAKKKPLVVPVGALPTASFFQTTLQKTLTCISCSYSRHMSETFRELSLDMPTPAPRPLCLCRKPPIQLTVKKDGPNHGRQFIKCSQSLNPCKFFEWEPDVPSPPPLDLAQLVSEVESSQVLQGNGAKSGYMLVYVQQDVVAPGAPSPMAKNNSDD